MRRGAHDRKARGDVAAPRIPYENRTAHADNEYPISQNRDFVFNTERLFRQRRAAEARQIEREYLDILGKDVQVLLPPRGCAR